MADDAITRGGIGGLGSHMDLPCTYIYGYDLKHQDIFCIHYHGQTWVLRVTACW